MNCDKCGEEMVLVDGYFSVYKCKCGNTKILGIAS